MKNVRIIAATNRDLVKMVQEGGFREDLYHRLNVVQIRMKEVTDAAHIATASVYGMDVLLTWNCTHMANPVTLPKTAATIGKAGFNCPVIITPLDFLARRKEFGI